MTLSVNGLAFLKQQEGFRPKMYKDAGGYSIGYGCLLSPQDVKNYEGKTLTEQEATTMLMARVKLIQAVLASRVKVPLNQWQYDALVSLCYNIGSTNFDNSTLLKVLNQGNYKQAAAEFSRHNKSQGKVLQALVNRRAAEAEMFRGD